MPVYQKYLPVIEDTKPSSLLGLIPLEKVYKFEGTETSHVVPVPAGGDGTVVLTKMILSDKTKWCMAAVFTHEQVYTKQHRGYPGFATLDAVGPGISWTSGTGLANNLRYVDGLALEGITNPERLGQGSVPLVWHPGSVSGTPVVGSELTLVEPLDMWQGQVDSVAYQWQSNLGAGWVNEIGATTNRLTPSLPGFYRIAVTASNVFGPSTPFYTDPVSVT